MFDSDVICYSVGYALNSETDVSDIKYAIDDYINRRLDKLESRDIELYLTDSNNNFRNKIYPQYKETRKREKPYWYATIKNHLIDCWDAVIIDYIEADDAIGILSTKYGYGNCVIVSNDKDLNQLPGLHMNMSSFLTYEVDEFTACKNLYSQWLIGDRIDNVPGIYKVGPVKVEKLFDNATTEEELRHRCLTALETALTDQRNSPTLWTNRWKHLMCLHLMRTESQYEFLTNEKTSVEELENWISTHKFMEQK